MNRRPVLVVGMHRSGTSLVAQVLDDLGVELGGSEEVDKDHAEDNERGFWEPPGLVELNDRILRSWGASWCHPHLDARPSTLDPTFRDEIETLAEDWGHRYASWAWKDPRLSLTWPFWLPHLPGALILWCVRHPLEVAASLLARNAFPTRAGLLLWEIYNREVAQMIGSRRFTVVDHDALLTSPAEHVGRLNRFLVEHLGALGGDLQNAVRRVSPPLRHHRFSADALFSGETATVSQKELYRSLRRGEVSTIRPHESTFETDALTEALGALYEVQDSTSLASADEQHWRRSYSRLATSFPVWGDINDDRVVDTADVLRASRAVLGLMSLSMPELARGKVAPLVGGSPQPADNDPLNAADLLLIERKALGVVSY